MTPRLSQTDEEILTTLCQERGKLAPYRVFERALAERAKMGGRISIEDAFRTIAARAQTDEGRKKALFALGTIQTMRVRIRRWRELLSNPGAEERRLRAMSMQDLLAYLEKGVSEAHYAAIESFGGFYCSQALQMESAKTEQRLVRAEILRRG